jgi:hypothetical protein
MLGCLGRRGGRGRGRGLDGRVGGYRGCELRADGCLGGLCRREEARDAVGGLLGCDRRKIADVHGSGDGHPNCRYRHADVLAAQGQCLGVDGLVAEQHEKGVVDAASRRALGGRRRDQGEQRDDHRRERADHCECNSRDSRTNDWGEMLARNTRRRGKRNSTTRCVGSLADSYMSLVPLIGYIGNQCLH